MGGWEDVDDSAVFRWLRELQQVLDRTPMDSTSGVLKNVQYFFDELKPAFLELVDRADISTALTTRFFQSLHGLWVDLEDPLERLAPSSLRELRERLRDVRASLDKWAAEEVLKSLGAAEATTVFTPTAMSIDGVPEAEIPVAAIYFTVQEPGLRPTASEVVWSTQVPSADYVRPLGEAMDALAEALGGEVIGRWVER